MVLTVTLNAHYAENKIAGKIFIIDAGHGGIDSGANRPGIVEKDINLAIALQLKEQLNQSGAIVILSRQTDIELSAECDNDKVRGRYHRDLAARVELADESNADLFISIHANAVANPNRRGAEVFYYTKSPASKSLADSIQQQLSPVTKSKDFAQKADYFVLRRNRIPAVLIEVGYITNPEERKLLQIPEYQRNLATAIAAGISNYYQ